MSMQIERRVSALERSIAPDSMVDTIVWRVIESGRLDAESMRIEGERGEVWIRQAGEAESDLIDRATYETGRPSSGVAQLFAYPDVQR